MEPLVSILIPVYNREDVVGEAIECAINQTYKNIEIVISDNKSTDGTWAIVQDYAQKDSRIKIYQNEENLGPVLNWQQCFNKATGEYARILWSDDKMTDTFIEHTLPLLDEDTAFVMSGLRHFYTENNETISDSSFQSKPVYTKTEFLYDKLISGKSGFPVSPGCALFRLADLRKSLMIDIPNGENLDFKKYGAGNDVFLLIRTANRYKQIKVINEIASFFRAHKDSITITRGGELEIYYLWARYYFVKEYTPQWMKEFKLKVFIKKRKDDRYKVLYDSIEVKWNLITAFRFTFRKIKEKF